MYGCETISILGSTDEQLKKTIIFTTMDFFHLLHILLVMLTAPMKKCVGKIHYAGYNGTSTIV